MKFSMVTQPPMQTPRRRIGVPSGPRKRLPSVRMTGSPGSIIGLPRRETFEFAWRTFALRKAKDARRGASSRRSCRQRRGDPVPAGVDVERGAAAEPDQGDPGLLGELGREG